MSLRKGNMTSTFRSRFREEAIFFQTADLLDLVVDVVFYDTTTVAFSIDTEDEEAEGGEALRKYGRSKEGTWDPQVVIALAVTREGLPVRSTTVMFYH